MALFIEDPLDGKRAATFCHKGAAVFALDYGKRYFKTGFCILRPAQYRLATGIFRITIFLPRISIFSLDKEWACSDI
jgi:hypothetical protein